MTWTEAGLLLLAGFGAGGVNVLVGSGGLITFPALLATGMPPVTANVTNTLGVLPGALLGGFGYRRELAGQRARVLRLASASFAGGVTGAVLLMALPSKAFESVVPFLVVGAVVLVAVQPVVARALRDRERSRARTRPSHGGAALWVCVLLVGVYGGYFGPAQGVVLLAALGLLLDDTLQRVNATKNVLAFVANGVAALLFVVFATEHIRWTAVGCLAVGAALGGLVSAHYGRRLPDPALRAAVVVVGLVAAVQVVTRT